MEEKKSSRVNRTRSGVREDRVLLKLKEYKEQCVTFPRQLNSPRSHNSVVSTTQMVILCHFLSQEMFSYPGHLADNICSLKCHRSKRK